MWATALILNDIFSPANISYSMLSIESPSLPFSVAAGIDPHRLTAVQRRVRLMAAHGNPRRLISRHQHHQEQDHKDHYIRTTPTTFFNKQRAAMWRRSRVHIAFWTTSSPYYPTSSHTTVGTWCRTLDLHGLNGCFTRLFSISCSSSPNRSQRTTKQSTTLEWLRSRHSPSSKTTPSCAC